VPSSSPPGPEPVLDTTVAHNARVWDYWLYGKDNYSVDRAVGDHIARMFPRIVEVARADRAFLARAVEYLAGPAGVRQFLDIGTGLPTANNTHEVAQRVNSGSKVVYVDNDPLVLVHARALLTSAQGTVAYVDADAREPGTILTAAAETLDFSQPVAIMMLGVLNFILDTDQAEDVVNGLLAAVPSGSHLVLTHPTLELGGEANAEAMRFWNDNATPPITARTGAEISRFLRGVDLVDPGLVSCVHWRPDPADLAAPPLPQYGAVGRKR
jgi:hypothetical protein